VTEIIVVGAGLAGLHAAWRLHRAGVEVTVLEARDRVGGRTWSQALRPGAVIERGGEFIAPGDDVLRGLAAELGLELVAHGFSFDRRPAPDRAAPTEAELAAFATWAAKHTAALTSDASVRDALPPAAEWASALWRLETSLTVPLTEVSARRTFGGQDHGYDPADRVRGGNQAVALELARRLGERVRLRSPIVAVRHTEGGATVVGADGRRHEAAAAIVAVPLPLLLELELDPGLPAAVRAAAGRTRFGDAAKLHIPLAATPAPGRMGSPDATWWCWTSQGSAALSCFAGGTHAVGALSAEAALALRPDVVADGDALFTHWTADPWTRGSYTAPGIGLTADDDAAWTRPWGSIVLAGEHTAGPRAGTMNGAAASGARAAEVTLALLQARS
jgi:monoamine oxidase